MGFEAQAIGGGEHLKEHTLARINQAAATGKAATDAAVGEHIEHLPVSGYEARQQVHLNLAVQGGQTRHVDLIVKIRAGAGRGTTNFKQDGRAGTQSQGAHVLHARRIAWAEQALDRQVTIKRTAALERGIGTHPQVCSRFQGRQLGQVKTLAREALDLLQARRLPLGVGGGLKVQRPFGHQAIGAGLAPRYGQTLPVAASIGGRQFTWAGLRLPLLLDRGRKGHGQTGRSIARVEHQAALPGLRQSQHRLGDGVGLQIHR